MRQVKPTFFLSAQKNTVVSLLSVCFSLAGWQGSGKDNCCVDMLPYILECGELNEEFNNNK